MPEPAPEEEVNERSSNATKKILQESEWKAMEKTMQAPLALPKKTQLKSEYDFEIVDKVNWNKLETSYASPMINWEDVNRKNKYFTCWE